MRATSTIRQLSLILLLTLVVTGVTMAASLNVAWDAPSLNADGSPLSDLASYNLYRCQGTGCTPVFNRNVGNVIRLSDTGLQDSTVYGYQVTALDTSGNESTRSNRAEAVTTSAHEWRINFQPTGSTAPVGYQADTGVLFDAARGYGWSTVVQARERNRNEEQRLDTLVFSAGVVIWTYTIPNGSYLVSLASGDPSAAQGPHRVMVEGVTAIKDQSTAANTFVTVTDLPVMVEDGALTVTIGGTSGYTMLNYLTMVSTGGEPPAAPGATTVIFSLE